MRELLVISMGGCRYGVWKDAVRSSRRIHGIHWLPLIPECFSGVTEVDGRTATLFDLSVCLGHAPFDRRLPGEAIILSEDPGPGGFVYSEESETVEVDPDALLPMPGFLKAREFKGCVVCAGEPVMVIDVSLLYERAMGPAWKSASFLPEDTAPPLELSSVRDVRLFEASGARFAAPAFALGEEAVEPGPIRPFPLAPPYVEGLCLHDGRIRAVISFARRLGLEDERRGMLLFAREGDFGFLVGSDLGRVGIKSEPLPMPPLAGRDSIPCAAVVEEEIIPLINIPALIGKDRGADLRGAYAPRSKFASLFGKRQVKVCEFSACGIPLSVPDSQVEDVRGFEAMRRMENLHPMMRGIAGHDGKVLPVLDLALCFGRRTGAGASSKMIYLRNGSFEALLLAEAVSGSRTLPVPEQRELPLNLPHQYVYGCYAEENEVRLILNVEALAVHFDREIVSDYFETIARETESPIADIPEKGRRAASPEAPSVAENIVEGSVVRKEGEGGYALPAPASPVAASFREAPEAMEKEVSGRTLYEKPLSNENQHMPASTGGSRAESSASGASGEGKGGNALEELPRTESEACGMPQRPGEPGEPMEPGETMVTKETKGHEIGGADVNAPHGEGAFERVPAGDRMKPPFSPGQAQTGPQAPGTMQEAAPVCIENGPFPPHASRGGKSLSPEADSRFREQPAPRLSGRPVQSGRRPSLRWAAYALIILASVLASYLAFMLAPGGDGMRGATERQAKADSAAQAPAFLLPVEDAPQGGNAVREDKEKGRSLEKEASVRKAQAGTARAGTSPGQVEKGPSATGAGHKSIEKSASSGGKEPSSTISPASPASAASPGSSISSISKASSSGGHTPLEGAEARSDKGARTGKGKGGDIPVLVIRPARSAEDSARMSPNAPRAPYDESGLYEVKRGDTLWHIARRFTGDPFNYPHIAYENSIPDPDLIFPGQTFTVRVIYGEEEGEGAE